MKSNTEQFKMAKKDLGESCRQCCSMGNNCCCYFVSKAFKQAGNGSLFYNGVTVTYCPNAIKWCKANLAMIPPYLAMQDDIIFFDWNLNGEPNHIGLVDEPISCDTIRTLEGNTTSRGVVAIRVRSTKYVQAIFRPHFPAKYDISKPIAVDGVYGYSSIALTQAWLGVTIDGILGKGTVKAIQKKVGVTQDGRWGMATSKALQKLIGATADGEFGEKSVIALQKYLNKQMFKSTTTQPTKPVAKPQTPSQPSVPTAPAKQTYQGQIPSLHVKKTTEQVIEDTVKWALWIAGFNKFHYGKGKEAHHNGCFFCGTQPKSKKKAGIKDWEYTYCCNPFIHGAFAHGGQEETMLTKCQKGSSYGFAKNEGYAKSKLFKALGKVARKKLKKGYVLCSDHHVALVVDDKGTVVQASGGDDNEPYSTSWNKSISTGSWTGYTRVYKYIGKVDADIPIMIGEYSDRVTMIQKFLNWYFGKHVVDEDGIFFEETEKYLKAFQIARKLVGDGVAGAKTLAEMETVKK